MPDGRRGACHRRAKRRISTRATKQGAPKQPILDLWRFMSLSRLISPESRLEFPEQDRPTDRCNSKRNQHVLTQELKKTVHDTVHYPRATLENSSDPFIISGFGHNSGCVGVWVGVMFLVLAHAGILSWSGWWTTYNFCR